MLPFKCLSDLWKGIKEPSCGKADNKAGLVWWIKCFSANASSELKTVLVQQSNASCCDRMCHAQLSVLE